MSEAVGYVYILTNPSFPDYVKIGYADNVEERVAQLNRSECTPFAFRVYATLEVGERLKDIPIHDLIDTINPSLRSRDEIGGKIRVREFYAMTPEDACHILELIAKFDSVPRELKRRIMSKQEKEDEVVANKISELAHNRHHFKEIDFVCSLTGHKYHGGTNSEGTLEITDLDTNEVIPNNSKPSKKTIIGQAIVDLGGTIQKDDTLYQRYHKLTKMILK